MLIVSLTGKSLRRTVLSFCAPVYTFSAPKTRPVLVILLVVGTCGIWGFKLGFQGSTVHYFVVFSVRHVGLCRILSSGFRHVFGCIYIYDVAQLTLCLQVAACLFC